MNKLDISYPKNKYGTAESAELKRKKENVLSSETRAKLA